MGFISLRFFKKITDEMVIAIFYLKPKEIGDKLSNEVNNNQPIWKGLTDYQVTTKVWNVRSKLQSLLQNMEELKLAKI